MRQPRHALPTVQLPIATKLRYWHASYYAALEATLAALAIARRRTLRVLALLCFAGADDLLGIQSDLLLSACELSTLWMCSYAAALALDDANSLVAHHAA